MDSYKTDIFEALKNKCYDFINSKYILSEIRIKAILEWIVINPSLYDFIKKCSLGIDFRYEFEKIKANNNGMIILPDSNRYIITIVVGILYDLDNGNFSLSYLLNNFFYEKDTEQSYKRFCDALIIPFIKAVSMLYLNDSDPVIDDSTEEEKKIEARKIDFVYLNKILNPILKELNTFIQGDNSIDDADRYDYTIMAEGLLHAMTISDAVMIKAGFIGLKNTVRYNKKYRPKLQNIEKILSDYSLI